MKKLDDEKKSMIIDWTNDIINIVLHLTNDNIDLETERLQLYFLFARFSAQVVYGALDMIDFSTKKELMTNLRKQCKARLKVLEGVQ